MHLDRGDWRHRLGLFALCVLVLGSALGSRDPWHIDEVRFVGIALEMLQRGEFWVPHRAGEMYADKPPIFFWVLATLFKITDSVRWSFLLPAFISGVITVQLIYDLGTRLWQRRVGLVAAVLLILTYQFWRSCTYANIDGFLLMWPTLAVYGFTRHLLSGNDARWFYLGFAAIAIGILSKGVGFLPLLIVIPYAIQRVRGLRIANYSVAKINARQWGAGIVLLLLLLATWLLPLLWMAQTGTGDLRAYLDNILFRQTAGRYANAWQHREPFWFFLTSIPKYWAPLSLLLPWLLPVWWRRLRRGDSRYVLLLGWALLVLLFFSASSGKREIYMLPALPALALAAAPALSVMLRKRWLNRAALVGALLLIAVPALVAVLRLTALLPRSPLNAWPLTAAYVLLILAAVNMLLFVALRRYPQVLRFCAVYAFAIAFFHKGVMPTMNASEAGVDTIAAVSAAAPAPLVYVQWNERTWLYSRAAFVHNGISTAKPECAAMQWSLTHPDSHWLLRAPDATRLGLAAGPTFASGDKKPWMVTLGAAAIAGCESASGPRYHFQWQAEALRRLHPR
ncbi:MAG: glycosyltransferase family 39 protein [Spongiibacteraceae bacterium]